MSDKLIERKRNREKEEGQTETEIEIACERLIPSCFSRTCNDTGCETSHRENNDWETMRCQLNDMFYSPNTLFRVCAGEGLIINSNPPLHTHTHTHRMSNTHVNTHTHTHTHTQTHTKGYCFTFSHFQIPPFKKKKNIDQA